MAEFIEAKEFHSPGAKRYIAHLNELIAEQNAYEHAVKTGEIKRTAQNSTPAKHLED